MINNTYNDLTITVGNIYTYKITALDKDGFENIYSDEFEIQTTGSNNISIDDNNNKKNILRSNA